MHKKIDKSTESFIPPKQHTCQNASKGAARVEKYEAPKIEELGRVAIITLKSATGTLTGI